MENPTNLPPKTYAGGAFHPELQNGQSSGRIILTGAGVQFESEKGNCSLPAEGLTVEIGGVTGNVIFFKHAGHPQTVIHTSDRSILQEPVLAGRTDVTKQLGGERRRSRIFGGLALAFVALVVGLIVLLIASKDRIVSSIANSIPVEWEVKFGDQVFKQLISSQREISDPALQEQLSAMTSRLLAGITNSPYQFRFHIVEDPTLNAFAVPGGHVVIHSGLLLAADDPEEVAGVLAHEIAHVTERHSFRNMVASLGMYQLMQLFVGDATGVIAVLANNSAFLMDRKFSRDFERDADRRGWDYLMQADIHPNGMVSFFKRMRAEEEKSATGRAGSALALISTHPATEERLAALEEKLRKLEKKDFREIELDFAAMKETLRGQLTGTKR